MLRIPHILGCNPHGNIPACLFHGVDHALRCIRTVHRAAEPAATRGRQNMSYDAVFSILFVKSHPHMVLQSSSYKRKAASSSCFSPPPDTGYWQQWWSARYRPTAEQSCSPSSLPLVRLDLTGLLLNTDARLGGFLFGYDIGVISGCLIMPDFTRRFGDFNEASGEWVLNSHKQSIITSLLSAGCVSPSPSCPFY